MNRHKPYERLVMIGFRCTGKSTLSKMLSTKLGLPVYSTDQLIEQITGMPIAEFVHVNGWERFREVESEAISKAVAHRNAIIDCGGGVIENEENMHQLCQDAFVIWVDASKEDIFSRMQQDNSRPLLSGNDLREDIQTNYDRREPLYRSYGMLRVDTSELEPEACVNVVAAEYSGA